MAQMRPFLLSSAQRLPPSHAMPAVSSPNGFSPQSMNCPSKPFFTSSRPRCHTPSLVGAARGRNRSRGLGAPRRVRAVAERRHHAEMSRPGQWLPGEQPTGAHDCVSLRARRSMCLLPLPGHQVKDLGPDRLHRSPRHPGGRGAGGAPPATTLSSTSSICRRGADKALDEGGAAPEPEAPPRAPNPAIAVPQQESIDKMALESINRGTA